MTKMVLVDKKEVVKNSIDDPKRKIVGNRLCELHDEIFVYRPSVREHLLDPDRYIKGMIEIKKCKDGCWKGEDTEARRTGQT